MLKTYISEQPKIIYTVRPIAEVLASLIAINKNSIVMEMAIFNWNFNNDL